MTFENLNVSTIITQMAILFLLSAIGFICARTRYYKADYGFVLSKYVIRIAMPMTILSKAFTVQFTKRDYLEGVWLFFFALFFLILTYATSCLITKRLRLPDTTANVYKIQSMFGNVIFFSFPVLMALFGDKGVLYALFYNMGNDLLLWTLGIYLISKDANAKKGNWKHLINPNTISFMISISCMLLGVSKRAGQLDSGVFKTIYNTLISVINMIGQTTSPVAMLFIGMMLAAYPLSDFKGIKKNLPIIALTAQKMLIFPAVSLVVVYLLRNIIPLNVILIGVLQLAMPIGTITASLAAEHKSDCSFATRAIFITSILSMLTLPALIIILKSLFL